jgi:hypothetical protein
LLSIQRLGLKVNYVGVNHGNGYKLFFNLSFHAFVRTSQEMWLLFGQSKLLGQCVTKWNDHELDQLWSQHSNPNLIRPWFGYVTNWLQVVTNHFCFGTRSLQISYMETSCIFKWNCTRRNLVLFQPHTLQLLLDLIAFQRHLVILSLQVLAALINGQYYS